MYDHSQELIDWLLDGDPSVRFQVMRDILDEPQAVWRAEQKRTAEEGWAARLLSYQDPEGTWASGLYSRKWVSTTYTLLQLRRMGLDPGNGQARRGCMILLDRGFFKDEGINLFQSWQYSETCVTALVLSLCAYFNIADDRLPKIARFLAGQQMKDGGWNCEMPRGAVHSSFHTTISVLEGLREYEKKYDGYAEEILRTRRLALGFMDDHQYYRSHRTGEVVDPRMTRFSFPPRWRYDLMRMFDFLQEAGVPWSEGMADAGRLILKKRNRDGSWNLQGKHSGLVWFDMEKAGKPSRWNTLRGLRILRWMEEAGVSL